MPTANRDLFGLFCGKWATTNLLSMARARAPPQYIRSYLLSIFFKNTPPDAEHSWRTSYSNNIYDETHLRTSKRHVFVYHNKQKYHTNKEQTRTHVFCCHKNKTNRIKQRKRKSKIPWKISQSYVFMSHGISQTFKQTAMFHRCSDDVVGTTHKQLAIRESHDHITNNVSISHLWLSLLFTTDQTRYCSSFRSVVQCPRRLLHFARRQNFACTFSLLHSCIIWWTGASIKWRKKNRWHSLHCSKSVHRWTTFLLRPPFTQYYWFHFTRGAKKFVFYIADICKKPIFSWFFFSFFFALFRAFSSFHFWMAFCGVCVCLCAV